MNARPPAPIRPTDRRRQRGMTLLELLVVVALMSAVGFMALSQVGDDLGQARYQDTENRLIALRRAIIGYEEPVFNGQRLFSGYAADNGRILTTEDGIIALIVKPEDFDDYDATSPQFDPVPDADGYNTGSPDEIPLNLLNEKLFKGWRGSYLTRRAGEREADGSGYKPVYRDAWGNRSLVDDDKYFGWLTDFPDTTNKITSLGRDGALGGNEPPYDDDLPMEISANDWMVNISSPFSIKIHNGTKDDIVLGSPKCLRVSLLVYRNQDHTSNDKKWLRLSSECISGAGHSTSCLDGADSNMTINDDGDATVAGGAKTPEIYCPETQEVSFTQSGLLSNFIPQGRHLLVVIVDEDGDPKHNASGNDAPCTKANGCPSAARTIKQVDFFSRAALPNVTLEIAQ